MTAQEKIEFPDQVPGVMQSGIHALTAEGAVNVGGITGDEDTPDAQLPDMPVMDMKVTAPVQGVSFDISRCT